MGSVFIIIAVFIFGFLGFLAIWSGLWEYDADDPNSYNIVLFTILNTRGQKVGFVHIAVQKRACLLFHLQGTFDGAGSIAASDMVQLLVATTWAVLVLHSLHFLVDFNACPSNPVSFDGCFQCSHSLQAPMSPVPLL